MGHKGISRKGRIAAGTYVVTGGDDHHLAGAQESFGAHNVLRARNRQRPETVAEVP